MRSRGPGQHPGHLQSGDGPGSRPPSWGRQGGRRPGQGGAGGAAAESPASLVRGHGRVCLSPQIIRVQSPDGVKRITATKRETAAVFLKKVPVPRVPTCRVLVSRSAAPGRGRWVTGSQGPRSDPRSALRPCAQPVAAAAAGRAPRPVVVGGFFPPARGSGCGSAAGDAFTSLYFI